MISAVRGGQRRDKNDPDDELASAMILNPFPGPQPFRVSDRAYFHGREELSRRLESAILAHRAVVVHGPSGSGKSSLIQASALPNLQDAEDVRVVHLDGWPPGEDPTHWLLIAMHAGLRQGSPPVDMTPQDAVLSSLKRAMRGSSRMLIICIDQLEQLLYPGRDPQPTEAFFDCVDGILGLPLRTLRVVMSLREDYLGVFRDRLRDHRRVLGQGFRVGPLTVAELTGAMCQMAASGTPSQTWDHEEMRALMMQVRVPGQAESDEAEAQAAYGQIVCRALFQQRATEEGKTEHVTQAEPILQGYLESTLADLGALRGSADRLLEDHLVSGDGGRTLRTEKELQRHFAGVDLQTILAGLEKAAILHAASHQGSRYFEIGHDWLARKVFEKRRVREQEEEQRRRDEEQARAFEKVRRERRVLFYVAVASLAGVVGAIVASLLILAEKRKAESAETAARHAALVARRREIDARDASILAGARELSSRGKLTWAMKLLPEIQLPALRRGWIALASDLLASNTLRHTLVGHRASLTTASFSPDGQSILTASVDGTARIWDPSGEKAIIELSGHTEGIKLASWSHDGKWILTVGVDGSVLIFSADGQGKPIELANSAKSISYAEFSPDDTRVVTASHDGHVRIHSLRGEARTVDIRASKSAVHCARFHPDGVRVFFSTQDEHVQMWDGQAEAKPVDIGKHDASVGFLAISPKGTHVVSTSLDGMAHIWNIQDKQARREASIKHDGPVHHAAFSADGKQVATASADRKARVLRLDGTNTPILLEGHTQPVMHVAFDPNGHFLATASHDGTARIFRIRGGASLVLRGHDAAVHSVAWKSDGASVVTASGDGTARSPDETAKVWNALGAQRLGLGSSGPNLFHAAYVTPAHHIVTAYEDGVVRVTRPEADAAPIVLVGSGAWVAGASLSLDGQMVATASFDKMVRLFHVEKPSASLTLGSHEAEARFTVFNAVGSRVLSGGDDGCAMIFDVTGKSSPVKLEGHRDWLTTGAWSADGKRVATGSFDGTARIWNAEVSAPSMELVGHDGPVFSVAFFSDNQRVATGSFDHTARIWTPGKEPQILQHEAAVYLVAVSPNNELVATYSADHLIRIWRLGSSDPPIEFESTVVVRALLFDSDSKHVTALDEQGALHRWTVDVEALREQILKANADCIPPSVRVLYLNESLKMAEERYTDCRQKPSEMPWFKPVDQELLNATAAGFSASTPVRVEHSSKSTSLGPNRIRAKIVVLPIDADVEVDGSLVTRRRGVVEFVGTVGETRNVRVQRGGKQRWYNVLMSAEGAKPTRIDLNENVAGSAGSVPRPASSARPGDKPPPDDALLPTDMQ